MLWQLFGGFVGRKKEKKNQPTNPKLFEDLNRAAPSIWNSSGRVRDFTRVWGMRHEHAKRAAIKKKKKKNNFEAVT